MTAPGPGVAGLCDLDDMTVVVTGASSGIGHAVASALAGLGADVIACARRLPEFPEQVDGKQPTATTCDVTKPDDRRRLIESALASFGHIDGVVNAAGYSNPAGPAADEDPAAAHAVWQVNVEGLHRLSAEAATHMTARGTGSIVNVASLSSFRSFRHLQLSSYAASKAAVVAITRELAAEYGPAGVRVNAIAPGFFPTAMTRYLADEHELAWIRDNTALRREGRMDDLIGPVAFLLGPASVYITGQTIPVDGGWTCY